MKMEKLIFASFLLLVGYGVAMMAISLSGGVRYPADIITAAVGSVFLAFYITLLIIRAVKRKKQARENADRSRAE